MNTKELLRLYTMNEISIYLVYEKLLNQVIKRVEAKKSVTLEHLEKCSTLYLIARLSARAVSDYDNCTVTVLDKRAFRHDLAAEIIENAKSVASL